MKSLCQRCHKREGTVLWIGEGSMMDYIHGMSLLWCEQCCISQQLKYAKKRAKDIPKLEAKLKKIIHPHRVKPKASLL